MIRVPVMLVRLGPATDSTGRLPPCPRARDPFREALGSLVQELREHEEKLLPVEKIEC